MWEIAHTSLATKGCTHEPPRYLVINGLADCRSWRRTVVPHLYRPAPRQGDHRAFDSTERIRGKTVRTGRPYVSGKSRGLARIDVAGVSPQWLRNFLDQHDLGEVSGADGMSRLIQDTVRGPDVAFVSWARSPDGIPSTPVPDLVPDFVIEMLGTGDTAGEMARKRREYCHAGVRRVWMVDPRGRTAAVFRSPEDFDHPKMSWSSTKKERSTAAKSCRDGRSTFQSFSHGWTESGFGATKRGSEGRNRTLVPNGR